MKHKKFSDSEATRIISALEARQDRKLKDSAQVATTWGTVGSVASSGKTVSAYIYGETDGAYMSENFRVPGPMYLTVGDVVKVGINYETGDRWVEEAFYGAQSFKKIVIDLTAGVLKTGDGTGAPTDVPLSILKTITPFIETLLDDVDAAAARTTLGLGSLATQSSIAHSATTGQTATDHHPAPAAGPDANITIDAAGAAGTVSTFARSGHGHQVVTTDAPSGANITIDAAATAAATGAIARAAHGHRLNTSSATPAVGSVAGSAGTSATAPSRGDHSHPQTAPIRRVYTSGTTWTKPSNLSHIEVEVVGGGGGGGGADATSSTQFSGGAGGGGGGYAKKLFTAADLSGASSFTYAVGAAGAAGANTGTTGGTGGNSTFSGTGITTVQGNGGTGGEAAAASAPTALVIRAGGAGGTSSGGDINMTGGDGGVYTYDETPHGRKSMGFGGNSFYGGTTRTGGADAGAAGEAGSQYGGGGSGAHSTVSQAGFAGGAGAAGVVIVTEYYL